MNLRQSLLPLILFAVFAWLALGGGLPSFTAPAKPTAVVYTYDKDVTAVPNPVKAALDKLNRAGIMATLDEVGPGEVPEQYEVSRPAAIAAGLPAAVVMGGDKVLRVVKNPTTIEQVTEAAQ